MIMGLCGVVCWWMVQMRLAICVLPAIISLTWKGRLPSLLLLWKPAIACLELRNPLLNFFFIFLIFILFLYLSLSLSIYMCVYVCDSSEARVYMMFYWWVLCFSLSIYIWEEILRWIISLCSCFGLCDYQLWLLFKFFLIFSLFCGFCVWDWVNYLFRFTGILDSPFLFWFCNICPAFLS